MACQESRRTLLRSLPRRPVADHLIEPEAARELIGDGCEALVEWCDGPGPVPVADDLDYILERAVDLRRAKRLARKSKVPTVFVSEQWQRDDEAMSWSSSRPPAPRAL